jgi:hypothetical protein
VEAARATQGTVARKRSAPRSFASPFLQGLSPSSSPMADARRPSPRPSCSPIACLRRSLSPPIPRAPILLLPPRSVARLMARGLALPRPPPRSRPLPRAPGSVTPPSPSRSLCRGRCFPRLAPAVPSCTSLVSSIPRCCYVFLRPGRAQRAARAASSTRSLGARRSADVCCAPRGHTLLAPASARRRRAGGAGRACLEARLEVALLRWLVWGARLRRQELLPARA